MAGLDRSHEDAAQRVPLAALEERPPGLHRPADGSLLLRRRLRETPGVRPTLAVNSKGYSAVEKRVPPPCPTSVEVNGCGSVPALFRGVNPSLSNISFM